MDGPTALTEYTGSTNQNHWTIERKKKGRGEENVKFRDKLGKLYVQNKLYFVLHKFPKINKNVIFLKRCDEQLSLDTDPWSGHPSLRNHKTSASATCKPLNLVTLLQQPEQTGLWPRMNKDKQRQLFVLTCLLWWLFHTFYRPLRLGVGAAGVANMLQEHGFLGSAVSGRLAGFWCACSKTPFIRTCE